MARMVKMEKDGIVSEVAASAFRNVWSRMGYTLAADDAPVDPPILGLGEGEDLESYKKARDEARASQDQQVQALDETLAARDEAERAAAAAQHDVFATATAGSGEADS